MSFISHFQKEVKKHFIDYLLLITAGIFFLMAVRLFSGERLVEFILLLFFVSFYIIWGISHHAVNKDLRLRTVLEYILIGFTIIFFLKIFILL